jgi:hypothetical protein
MLGFKKIRQSSPFARLFQVVSPKEFITIFNSELAQTKAFILSFSPRKGYVKKVLHLLNSQESDRDVLMDRSSFIIREYLNRCSEDTFNINFVQGVEKEVESMITGYENFHDLRSLRKKLIFKHPKEVQIIQKMEKESFENEKKETESRFPRIHDWTL